ncbi:right-handed parallel beta-helix repeat-containing protein [Leifsonia shinshuensis]|uniref:right-handed parallel beta-helix repeat-containing protein n=1 Tax=Leifsonia shinshuensis TaxID=150026 RepID=UPI0028554FBC|nr:right-handed parallel beta-helix repeat-containing protein [Leifsonia shinshuensis]MDR6972729.1 CshA-type fibril repeat protein [Leifsonia shinshuensis]
MRNTGGLLAAAALALGIALVPAAPSQAATFTVTTTADSGAGSLRQAMTDANSTAGTHTITFAIPGTGPHLIAPLTALPQLGTITASVSIDGCSQPGAVCGPGVTPSPRIQIKGSTFLVPKTPVPVAVRGLSITGTSRGVVGNRTAVSGAFRYPDGLTVEDNLFGITPDGAIDPDGSGVICRNNLSAEAGPSDVTIRRNAFGGSTVGINCSNNYAFGVGGLSSGLVIADNRFGVDAAGGVSGPNATAIGVGSTTGAQITGNIIANGTGTGVTVQRGNSGLLIEGNEIRDNGTDGIALVGGTGNSMFAGPVAITGNTITGNGRDGVSTVGASDVTIGGASATDANTITGNSGDGVAIGVSGATDTGSRVTVRGNAIDGNTGLGIDLADDGVTPNGPAGVLRTGPNSLIDYPVLDRVQRGSTHVTGVYTGAANATYTLDFYLSPTRDTSGHGEGAEPLGSSQLTTDATGAAAFDVTFPATIGPQAVVTATATDAAGSTSEFSAALSVGPTATDDRLRATAGQAVTAQPAADDAPGDAPVDASTLRLIDPATGALTTSVTLAEGDATVAADGSVTFTPAAGRVGASAAVQYSVADTTGARSAPVTLALVIGPAAADANVTTAYRHPVDVDLSSGTAPGSAFAVTTPPKHGEVTSVGGGVLRYTPDAGFAGGDEWSYQVCAPSPDEVLCDTGRVHVTVSAPALAASPQHLSGTPAGGGVGTVIGSGTVDGQPSTAADVLASAVDAPAGIAIEPGGDVRLAAGIAAGHYAFVYRLCLAADPTTCATASITVQIDPVAAAPTVASGDGTPAGLATTGSDLLPPLLGALAVLLIGGMLVGIRRRAAVKARGDTDDSR